MTIKLTTVTAVSKGARRVSDHAPYINSVIAALVARDVTVTDVPMVQAQLGPCREAVLYLQADPDAFAFEMPDEAVAFWDEVSGWSLTVTRGDRETEFFEGTRLVPDPDEVAAWMVVVLTNPRLEAARGETRFREPEDADSEFEAQLARYVPDQ